MLIEVKCARSMLQGFVDKAEEADLQVYKQEGSEWVPHFRGSLEGISGVAIMVDLAYDLINLSRFYDVMITTREGCTTLQIDDLGGRFRQR